MVDRFAMELQSKQNKYIERLKHKKGTKQANIQKEVPVARSEKSEQLVSRRRTPPPNVMEPHISFTKFVPRTGTHKEKARRKDENRKQKRFPHNWNQSRQRHHQTSQLTLDHLLRENFRSSRSRLRRIHKRT
ncbi:hypothetical protein ANCCAN_20930 [Ancylostoma caninum]|uniref:Uncharacterized protein n=1 Tax=Ancylostoma caninum TaxID=29170 RepID=A0A368FLY5_ANCCA|nr:hypothetical protein ANCCAN_20930 [Ancylostoma caninum]